MVFNGTVESDLLKLVKVDDIDKQDLINFAATDFLSLRKALVDYIKAVYPLDYNYFAESDLGMMLVELVAYMGHVLSYKADYLANENYLKTARSRQSVKKLLQLIGIRMKGPIAAAADARLTFPQNPGWQNTSKVVITPQNRVISISSPEDGLPLTYTVYKVNADGNIDFDNGTGSIEILNSEKSSDTVLTNLVLLEGSLVVETGNFADTEILKSINLQQGPIIEGSVQVFIEGTTTTSGIYKQVENLFFASGPSDKVYQLISNDNYGGTVVFGDNNTSKGPNVGDAYTVQYRVGGGTRGNIINSLINAGITVSFETGENTSNITATIENISKGTGGADAETIEHAKRYAPLYFRTQNRLVTLQDYKAFVNSFITSYGSIGKATASTRRAYSSANIIDVYVLEKASDVQLKKSTPEYKRQIIEAINEIKMLTDEVVVVDGLIRSIDLIITVRLDEKYKVQENTIKTIIGNTVINHFNVDKNDFGKEFNPSDLMHSIFTIPQVRFATIDNVQEVIKMNFNEIAQLNNFTINIIYV